MPFGSTLRESNMAMDKTLFIIDDFPIKTSIYRAFPIAMFDYQRVIVVSATVIWCHGTGFPAGDGHPTSDFLFAY